MKPEQAASEREAMLLSAEQRRIEREARLRALGFQDVSEEERRRNLAQIIAANPWPR